MTLTFPSPEFDDVVAATCHGTATEAQMQALNSVLRGDPAARDEYLLRVELHSRLASEPDLFAQAPPDCALLPLPAESIRGQLKVPTSAQAVSSTRPRALRRLALAAGFVVAALGLWALASWRFANRPGATSTAVAMLTRTVDARWADPGPPPRVGSALEPGSLRLQSGLAQVVFYSGARVVIEGPAELRLVSPREAVCPAGRLLAEVPEPARGFQLRTDHLNVVDLGTSFGVDVAPGRTEVHVFKGAVELAPGNRVTRALRAGDAAVVQPNAAPQLMAARAESFAAMFEFQQRSLAAEAYRYEQWQFASARLNQDPSVVVHLDFEHLNGTDWTLPNAARRNRSVPEATVVGCVRAEGRWREKQALEFQSVSDRVRLVVPGDFDALTLSAWVAVKGLDRQFNSLFMCDGFDPGTVHWLIRNDGVLGLTVFGPAPGTFQILASPPVIHPEELGTWLHLAVVLDGRNRHVVHYVNGEPVERQTLRFSPPFRIGATELGNWNARSGSDPAPVLIRNLTGSFDEFTLFSRALTDAELRDLYLQGRP